MAEKAALLSSPEAAHRTMVDRALTWRIAWVIPLGFAAGELFSLGQSGRTLLARLTKDYGDLGHLHGLLMRHHVWSASLMWVFGASQVLLRPLRKGRLAWVHRSCGYAFLMLWVAIVGPTSFYLSLVIKGEPPLGTLGSIILLDVTFLSYYFFFRAWRVARERLSGAHSLMLHGRLMSLGLLTTMSLLGQRMFVFTAVAARTAAVLLLRRMPHSAAESLASLLESVVSDKALFGVSLMFTGAGYLGFVDGPRSPWLDWGFSKADEHEMYGGEARADHRWRWRCRLLVYLVARGMLEWWRAKDSDVAAQ